MKILCLLILMISHLSFAQEYKSIALVPAPSEVLVTFDKFFRDNGFLGFKGAEEYLEVGLNQIFFTADLSSFVSVKYGVEGDFPLNEVLKVADGNLVHIKYEDTVVAFHFLNVPQFHSEKIISKLQKLQLQKRTSILEMINPISSAHAQDECSAMDLSVMGTSAVGTMAAVTMTTIISGLSSCLSGATEEVKSSSGFNFISAVSGEANRLWTAPGKRIGEYWGAAKTTVVGLGNLIYNLGYAILHPAEAAQKLGAILGEAGTMLSSMIGVFAKVPNAAVSMICSLITGIGVRTFVAAISGGAAAALLAMKLGKIVKAMGTISSLMNKMKQLGIGQIEKLGLSPENLAKLFSKLGAGTFDERRLSTFVRSLGDDSEFAKKMARSGLQCAL